VADQEELRQGLGKYFGVCPSYHHSKACLCKDCPSYPGEGYMFCVRGPASGETRQECMCNDCYVYHQFALDGDYFCRRE